MKSPNFLGLKPINEANFVSLLPCLLDKNEFRESSLFSKPIAFASTKKCSAINAANFVSLLPLLLERTKGAHIRFLIF